MTVRKVENLGHPWTYEPGWDRMLLLADDGNPATLARMVKSAKERFWRVWYQGRDIADMYKPSGRTSDWQDIPWQGTPRGHGHRFAVGEEVYTDFSGRITKHRIIEIQHSEISLAGVRFRVSPPVPGSEFIADDPGRPARVHGNVLIDASWFRKVET